MFTSSFDLSPQGFLAILPEKVKKRYLSFPTFPLEFNISNVFSLFAQYSKIESLQISYLSPQDSPKKSLDKRRKILSLLPLP